MERIKINLIDSKFGATDEKTLKSGKETF